MAGCVGVSLAVSPAPEPQSAVGIWTPTGRGSVYLAVSAIGDDDEARRRAAEVLTALTTAACRALR